MGLTKELRKTGFAKTKPKNMTGFPIGLEDIDQLFDLSITFFGCPQAV
jgi:hypothetical protein